MRKLKLFFACLLMAVLSIGQVWATEELKATLDFTTNTAWQLPVGSGNGLQDPADYSNGTYTINLSASTKYYFNSDGYLMIGKSGSKLTLPAFSWTTTKIVVVGNSNASKDTKQNIYVGETAVSTETTSSKTTQTYNIASGYQAAGNVYSFQVTSNHNAQVTKIEIYGEASGGDTPPTPAKTLESVAISGTATALEYSDGDEFDPAGLKVIGHYSDNSDAEITDGITWAFNPATLSTSDESVSVTATVGGKTSAAFVVNDLSVAAAPAASNWQVTAPADLATGDVVVLTMLQDSKYYAASNNNGTSAPTATVVAVTGSKLSNAPAETLQWTVTVVSEGVFQFAVGNSKLYCTDTNNGVKVGSGDYNTFDINTTNNKQYLHTTATMNNASNGRYLGVYNNADWRCYTSVNTNIQNGTLVIFRESSDKKPAGLAYATANYLVKKGASFTAPSLTNPNNLSVSYESSDESVAEVAANGAITLKNKAGKAEITASFDGDNTYKAGSAKYTIYVAEQAGTADEPLTEASAKDLIDWGCTMDVYMVGTVATKNYYTTSKTYTVDLEGEMQYYYFYEAAGETVFETDYLKVGDIITAFGTLKKASGKYRLNPSYMVERIEYTEPLVDISNTKETAYSVATALTKAADATSDLDNSRVFISGVVYNVKNFDSENGTLDIYIKDAGVENKFEFYKCKGINDGNATTPFVSADDVQVGNVVIGYGMLKYYSGSSTWEFDDTKEGDYLVDLQKPVTGVQLAATAEVMAGSTVNLTASILPSNATGTIVWSVQSGSDYASVADGVVTGKAEGEAVIRATVDGTAFYAECTVTVTAALEPIESGIDNPLTVAAAIDYIDEDPVAHDLTQAVWVRGVVTNVSQTNGNNPVPYIDVKDADPTNSFRFYNYTSSLSETPAENDTIIATGLLDKYNTTYELNGCEVVKINKYIAPEVAVQSVEMAATAEVEVNATVALTAIVKPDDASNKDITWSVQSGSDYASVNTEGVVTGKAAGTAVIRATSAADENIYAECTVTIKQADTRKIANSPATFTTTSGNLTPADIAYAADKGGASTDPGIYNDGIRLYQKGGTSNFGGFITLTAKAGCTIDEVQITTTSKYATTVAYSVDGNENLLKSESVAKSGSYTTGTGLNVSSVNILNLGSGSDGRLEIASIKVYYTGEAATFDHYELGGTYQTAFMQDDEFNHDGLIVYAAYDALGENKEDITASCTFSEPDMSTTGDKTIKITYSEAVVASYTITVNADSRKVANSPATFTTVSGDMTPNDITFAANQGDASTAPANYNDGIRLYQAPNVDKIGGYITLKAKKGCAIDQVKITTTNTYATTVAYSVDGNETLLGSKAVDKSSDYSTPSGLNVESVNIVNKGTGSNGRLEIASIKVYYTGEALDVDHYILGGTYATEFEQYGEFNFEGLTVTAAYDELETITEAVTGFTVEADLSTAGAKKANVMLNSVKIAEYDITVTASAKEDPALAYSPASVVLTLGDALSAPTFSNTHNVSPITYNSDKPAVATVDAEGNIALAGGTGVAVITASFAGDDDYIESEATFTITVNEPAEDLSGTWVVASSVAAGDRIIIGSTKDDKTYAMGKQNSNPNRAAVEGTLADGVLTPGEGTKTFLVVDAGEGLFALQAMNGKYLSSATSGSSNNLVEADDYTLGNAKWTISINDKGVTSVVAAAGSKTVMQYNNGSTLFSCYGSASQTAINIFKIGTPDYGSYQRDVTNGNYGTICLPKAGKITGATLYRIADKADNMIYIEEVGDELAAGVPYIFQATSDKLNVVYTSATEEEAGNANGLYGSYTQQLLTVNDGNYILYNNQYWLVNTEAYVGENRAYIKIGMINDTAPVAGRRRVAMTVNGEQVATGIDALNAGETPVKVLINGEMYILRGEKMYDATGRLVK